MALWRSGDAAVCKTVYTGSIPVGASMILKMRRPPVELVVFLYGVIFYVLSAIHGISHWLYRR